MYTYICTSTSRQICLNIACFSPVLSKLTFSSRSFNARQEQTKSEMKGLIIILVYVSARMKTLSLLKHLRTLSREGSLSCHTNVRLCQFMYSCLLRLDPLIDGGGLQNLNFCSTPKLWLLSRINFYYTSCDIWPPLSFCGLIVPKSKDH